MSVPIALLAGIAGYLIGSFSFARLLIRIRGKDVSRIVHAVEGSNKVFASDSISATATRFQLGSRYGCLVAILDILKAVVPTLLFKLWQPDAPYYLITATLLIIGHNYPLYYGFKGGRGLATIYGGFLVLDWIGVLATNTAGMILGGLLGKVLLMRWAGLLLMIPWTWFRTRDVANLAYVLIANALFWFAMLPELRQYLRLRREGELPDEQQVAEFMGMGRVYRVVQRFSLAAHFAKKEDGSSERSLTERVAWQIGAALVLAFYCPGITFGFKVPLEISDMLYSEAVWRCNMVHRVRLLDCFCMHLDVALGVAFNQTGH